MELMAETPATVDMALDDAIASSRSRSRTRGRPREPRSRRSSPARSQPSAGAIARVSNLHPRVTSGDLQRLFGASARWVTILKDALGRPAGRADVGFTTFAEARAAAERWRHVPLDGYALEIEVERGSATGGTGGGSRRHPRQRRERWAAGERRAQARVRHRPKREERPAAPTAASLDADLDSYMMQK